MWIWTRISRLNIQIWLPGCPRTTWLFSEYSEGFNLRCHIKHTHWQYSKPYNVIIVWNLHTRLAVYIIDYASLVSWNSRQTSCLLNPLVAANSLLVGLYCRRGNRRTRYASVAGVSTTDILPEAAWGISSSRTKCWRNENETKWPPYKSELKCNISNQETESDLADEKHLHRCSRMRQVW